jgi:NAD(P)H-dependent FMN reductase
MFKNILLACLIITSSLFAETKVLTFAGSTRQESFNKKLAIEAGEIAKQMGAQVTHIDLRDLNIPFYDEDLEKSEGMPEGVKKLRQLMIESDKIIIASPSYNGSISGVLKNAIDWASRNEDGNGSREAFKGKMFLIISTSPGEKGGVNGLRHLREVIINIGGEVIEGEFGVPNANTSFDSQGKIQDPELKEQLKINIEKLFA